MALPEGFMSKVMACYGKPSAFSRLIFGTPLHAGQRRYVRRAVADTNFLLPGNSWGKTEFIARYLVYLSWFKDGPYRPLTFEEWLAQEYKGLITSYTYPIAMESYYRLDGLRDNREEVRALITSMTLGPPARATFSNGSIVEWGSLDGEGRLVEAARRRFIMVDEAGHIPDLSSSFDNILYPRTMGVGGRIHLLGTPKPHSDPYLLEVAEKGRIPNSEYYSQEGSVFENEFWPQEEKARVLRNSRYVKGWLPCPGELVDGVWACPRDTTGICWAGDPAPGAGFYHPILSPIGTQVLLGAFVIAGGYFFNRQHTTRMFSGESTVHWHGENHFSTSPGGFPDLWTQEPDKEGRLVWRFKVPDNKQDRASVLRWQQSRLFLSCFDLGGNKLRRRKKKGSDATVGFTIDYTTRPWRIVHYHYIEGGEMDWQGKYETMAEVARAYPSMYLLIDATGSVDSVQEALQDRGVEVEGIQLGGNSSKKLDMLRNLQLCLELEWDGNGGVIRSPLIPGLKHELDHYVLPDENIEQDRVMTLAMLTHHIAQWELPAAVSGDVY